ncbi:BtrH N-terminal domain-containing protein [uncultured Acinetobacter sp.]|uniref:BtrH N-terminal domain-containing protein n=1 Tax=uncultured Acinetobacter sp. TaxID=165433 RepID=UPI00262E4F46|nr:BtrH N-terminal domain-containing protein [uncultured Acinetobacter sp.]
MRQHNDIFIPPSVPHIAGRHCGSSAIRDLVDFHGITLSEAMCFGLGSGLGITYLELPNTQTPFIVHVRSMGYEAEFFARIGVPFAWTEFDTPQAASVSLEQHLAAHRPALLLTDIYYLPYFASKTHFPGHAIIAWQMTSTGDIWVTDTERPTALTVTTYALEQARFSTSPPFIHYGNQFAPASLQTTITAEMLTAAIHANANTLQDESNPLSGLTALDTWISDLPRWQSTGDWRWTTRFAYQVIEKRGTGGSGFRAMYAEFLSEAAVYVPRIEDCRLPILMQASAQAWCDLAMLLKAASEASEFPMDALAECIRSVKTTEQQYVSAALRL